MKPRHLRFNSSTMYLTTGLTVMSSSNKYLLSCPGIPMWRRSWGWSEGIHTELLFGDYHFLLVIIARSIQDFTFFFFFSVILQETPLGGISVDVSDQQNTHEFRGLQRSIIFSSQLEHPIAVEWTIPWTHRQPFPAFPTSQPKVIFSSYLLVT